MLDVTGSNPVVVAQLVERKPDYMRNIKAQSLEIKVQDFKVNSSNVKAY